MKKVLRNILMLTAAIITFALFQKSILANDVDILTDQGHRLRTLQQNSGFLPTFHSGAQGRIVQLGGTLYAVYKWYPDNNPVDREWVSKPQSYDSGLGFWGGDMHDGYVKVVKSTDDGATWQDFYVGSTTTATVGRATTAYAPNIVIGPDNLLMIFFYTNNYNASLTVEKDRLEPRILCLEVDSNGEAIPKFNVNIDPDEDGGFARDKASFAYDPVHERFYTSGRDQNEVYLFVREFKLDDPDDPVEPISRVAEHRLVDQYGHYPNYAETAGVNDVHMAGEYSSLHVDDEGRLHIIYNMVYRDGFGYNRSTSVLDWIKVSYMYADWDPAKNSGLGGLGDWHKADGATVTVPLKANDFVNGGTLISRRASYSNISSVVTAIGPDNQKYIHILDTYSNYTRIKRSTGEITQSSIPGSTAYGTLVKGAVNGTIYMFGAFVNKPALFVSENNGDTWTVGSVIDHATQKGSYTHGVAMQTTQNGRVMGLIADMGSPVNSSASVFSDVLFASYDIHNLEVSSYYSFETTVSGSIPANDDPLSKDETLKGPKQIKNANLMNLLHGKALGTTGKYQTSTSGTASAAFGEIKGAAGNGVYATFSSGSYTDGISLGNTPVVRQGLTIEGWFRPTHSQGQGMLISKRSAGTALHNGIFYTSINSDYGLNFSIFTSATDYYTWNSSANLLHKDQWTYIAITWDKNSNQVTFYSKEPGKAMFTETVTNAQQPSGFDGSAADEVTIGYNAGWNAGYLGSVDEVRISSYSRKPEELLASNDSGSYYRFETTASGSSVQDGMRLDANNGRIKDQTNIQNGLPLTTDSSTAATYQSSDTWTYLRPPLPNENQNQYVAVDFNNIAPVPANEIQGASSNNFFVKNLALIYPTHQNDVGAISFNDLGVQKVGRGLTLEGWFWPDPNPAKKDWNTSYYTLFSKEAGGYFMALNGAGQIAFSIGGGIWYSTPGLVKFGEWNYIAMTWDKNSQYVDFYVKQVGQNKKHEVQLSNSARVSYDGDASDLQHTFFGTSVGANGFMGYYDEIRVSNFKRTSTDLLNSSESQETAVTDTTYYRLEAAANEQSVFDGASLKLYGDYQVRDEMKNHHGNPTSNGSTYQRLDNTITAVDYSEIQGAATNHFFGKLNSSNQEGVSVGDIDLDTGLTLEGWFYPTADKANADTKGLLISKQGSQATAGDYSLKLDANGAAVFTFWDAQGTARTWTSDSNLVQWHQWNYIGVTWSGADPTKVKFYIKQIDKKRTLNEKTQTMSTAANSNHSVIIGYNTALSKGFDGYFDEVRVSNYARSEADLLLTQTNYYRFESKTDSSTPADGTSLSGSGQIMDEFGIAHGTLAVVGSSANGTYRTSASYSYNGDNYQVNPVPYTYIRGADSNSRFASLTVDSNNNQTIDIGDVDVGTGLTIEGWFWPAGDPSLANGNPGTGDLVSKVNSNGNTYRLLINNGGGALSLMFSVTVDGNTQSFFSANYMIKYNQWNYIAVTWKKNAPTATFYAKPMGEGYVANVQASNYRIAPEFSTAGVEPVKIGYNSTTNSGFHGYVDEVRISNFARSKDQLLLPDQWYYRFEKTAAGTTGVSNGSSLALDGTFQVKSESRAANGNATGNGTNPGTYQTSAGGGTILPVDFSKELRDATGNGYIAWEPAESNHSFASLSYSNHDSIVLGNIDIGQAITIEGWFYITDAPGTYPHLIQKGDGSPIKAGDWVVYVDPTNALHFTMQDGSGFRNWVADTSRVQIERNQWNYIAIIYRKGFNDVEFYVKRPNGALQFDQHSQVVGPFVHNDDPVTIGYNSMTGGGFTGYVDEVRISDKRLNIWELLGYTGAGTEN